MRIGYTPWLNLTNQVGDGPSARGLICRQNNTENQVSGSVRPQGPRMTLRNKQHRPVDTQNRGLLAHAKVDTANIWETGRLGAPNTGPQTMPQPPQEHQQEDVLEQLPHTGGTSWTPRNAKKRLSQECSGPSSADEMHMQEASSETQEGPGVLRSPSMKCAVWSGRERVDWRWRKHAYDHRTA